jgi:hypothetical protein
MIPPYNPDLFQRIYQDVLEIKKEYEKLQSDHDGHEWIDFDQSSQCILQDEQYIVVQDLSKTPE